MATQELAGFAAALIFASKTGLLDKFIKTKNGNGGPYGPPEPPQEDDKPPILSGECLSSANYFKLYPDHSNKDYQLYLKISGCRTIGPN